MPFLSIMTNLQVDACDTLQKCGERSEWITVSSYFQYIENELVHDLPFSPLKG